MNYAQLTNTYKDDTIAEAMYGREVEYFHYEFDAKNFEFLLLTEPAGPNRDNLIERLEGSRAQMANVEGIYEALKAQITDEAAHQAAIVRTTKKREEDNANT